MLFTQHFHQLDGRLTSPHRHPAPLALAARSPSGTSGETRGGTCQRRGPRCSSSQAAACASEKQQLTRLQAGSVHKSASSSPVDTREAAAVLLPARVSMVTPQAPPTSTKPRFCWRFRMLRFACLTPTQISSPLTAPVTSASLFWAAVNGELLNAGGGAPGAA